MQVQLRHIAAVFLILAEILALIWVFPYLPMVDLPEHMLAAQVLTHYHSAGYNYPAFFTMKIPWNPYSSYFLFVFGTEPVLGIRNATRLYLSLAFVLTILAFWYWVRTVTPGRDALVIPSTLLLFGFFFHIGLINFLFSAPFLFFSLALAWRILAEGKPGYMTGLLLAASLLMVYLSHIVTFGLTGLMIMGVAVFVFKGKRLTRLIWPAIPASLLFAVYSLTEARQDVASATISYDPFMDRLATLLMPLNIFWDSIEHHWTHDRATLILWSLAIIIMVWGALLKKPGGSRRPAPWPVWLMTGMFVCGTFLLPSYLSGGLGVALRSSYFAAFAALALLSVTWDQNRLLAVLMLLVCAAYPVVMASRMVKFTSEMKGLESVIFPLPSGKVIQPVMTDLHSAGFGRTYALLHAAAWYSFYKGGASPYLIATWANHFPVRTRGPVLPHPTGEWEMGSFRYDVNAQGTDYFLVRTRDPRIIADLTHHVPLATKAGDWMVFGPNR